MKKNMLTFIIIMVFVAIATTAFAGSSNMTVNAANGTVELNVGSSAYSNFKAIIEKDDVVYIYNLVSKIDTLPLQMGSGKYTIIMFGSNDGRRFNKLFEKSTNVTLEENVVFLSSSQTVNWNDESKAAVLAKELTDNAENDKEKFDAIYNYVINNVSYDYNKASSLEKGYIPNADNTLAEGQGICYDFAALTASMLRSVNIPTKLVKGYSSYTSVYHAWNEVFIDGKWIVVDASTDSIYVNANISIVVEKDTSNYLASKVY